MRRWIAVILLAGIVLLVAGCGGGGGSSTVSQQVPVAGGEIKLPGRATLLIPDGALNRDVTVTLSSSGIPPGAPYWGKSVGEAINIDLGGETLSKPATLELPYETASPPTGQSEDIVLVGYYDEQAKKWTPVGGKVDPSRHVVTVDITHASWWQPWSWVVDAIVQGIVTAFKLDWRSLVDAQAAFDGCVQSPAGVIIDESSSKIYLGTCVEVDHQLRPRLRVVNRRTFDEKVYPVSGAVSTDLPNPGQPLGRLERRSFNADFSSAPVSEPLVVRAEVDWPTTFGHALLDVFDLVPGLRTGNAGQQILAELYKNRDFVLAAEALSTGDAQTFRLEFPKALAAAADLVARFTGFDLRLLLPVFQLLGGTAIAIQFVDAATSARVGPGDIKFYSNRPSVPPPPTNVAPGGYATPEEAAAAWVARQVPTVFDSVGSCPQYPPYLNRDGGHIWYFRPTGDAATVADQIRAGRIEYFYGFCGAGAAGFLQVERNGGLWAVTGSEPACNHGGC